LNTPGDRAAAARHLIGILQKIQDPIVRNAMTRDLSEKLNIDEKLIWNELRMLKNNSFPAEKQTAEKEKGRLESAEQSILMLLLEGQKKWLEPIFRHLEKSDLHSEEGQILFEMFHQSFLKNGSIQPQTALDQFADNTAMSNYLTTLLSARIGKDIDRYQLGLDCVLLLRLDRIQNEIQKTREELKQTETAGKEVHPQSQKYLALKKKYDQTRQELTEAWKKTVEI
jgi:DNA primase